ncbi:cold-shock protein [Streptomyces litchfieldiae]|uniref:Cold shock domain-containing protein n=1 Tax=Streptomyces litchfieldiae TaxID=3075543 RepID=A0ABU2MMI1_9ACTN|nr:cold shock domain-containing protein [Streptomyces sp. DSM 44938]MDT0342329.1 cold shock domain-containing protein [Streptomyces sp. DSM 44938]
MAHGTVREWHDEEGWGVLDSAETPGGCFAHFSDIDMKGFRSLTAGQHVEFDWERPGFAQDGYDYRTLKVVPL